MRLWQMKEFTSKQKKASCTIRQYISLDGNANVYHTSLLKTDDLDLSVCNITNADECTNFIVLFAPDDDNAGAPGCSEGSYTLASSARSKSVIVFGFSRLLNEKNVESV